PVLLQIQRCFLSIPSASSFHSTDRKSTRLNSTHLVISYAVFCLKKKKYTRRLRERRTLPVPPRTSSNFSFPASAQPVARHTPTLLALARQPCPLPISYTCPTPSH